MLSSCIPKKKKVQEWLHHEYPTKQVRVSMIQIVIQLKTRPGEMLHDAQKRKKLPALGCPFALLQLDLKLLHELGNPLGKLQFHPENPCETVDVAMHNCSINKCGQKLKLFYIA